MKPHAVHHIHKRKRFHKKLEPYPHPKRWVKFLDNFLLVVAVIVPLMTIPQIYKILIERNAAGVSAATWGMFTLFAIPWLVYGIVHKEKPIIVSSVLWLVVDGIVAVLAVVY